MKKILLFLALINLVQFGQSVTYLQDSFSTDGNLNGQEPIIGGDWDHAGGMINQMQVVGGRARLVGGDTEDLESGFDWGGGGSIFLGFTLNVTEAPNIGTGGFFATFRDGIVVGNIFIFSQNANTFRLGIDNTALNGAAGRIDLATDFPLDQDVRVVMRLTENGANDSMRLWVNPTSEFDASISTANSSFIDTATGFMLRQDDINLSGQFGVDNLIIIDNFEAAQGPILSIDDTGNPLASNLNQGTTNRPIYGFRLTAHNQNSLFSAVDISRTLNGALANNVSNYRLYYDNDDNGFDAGDVLLATVPSDNATLHFAGFAAQAIQVGVPRRYVVVADVAVNAVDSGTISLQVVNNNNLTTTANGISTVAPYPNMAVAHAFQDVTAPVIAALNPADNAVNVSPNVNLIAQFSENIQVGGGNITIVRTIGGTNFEVIPVGDPRVSIVGSTVTINPNGILSSNVAYHVLIANGAIRDLGNNVFTGITNNSTWNFVTSANLNTAPTIEGVGIADVIVEESSPPTVINLRSAFQDTETTDANLIYSVTATNHIDGDTEIFSNIAVDNTADTLTLNYLPNSNGVYTITVRATDAEGLFVENTFQITILLTVNPGIGSTNITSLILTPTNGFLFVGKTLQMTATGLATSGGATNVTLASTWSSGATNIAIVDKAGVVTGVKPGDVFITSVLNGLTKSVKVKVRKELLITFSKVKPAKLTTRLKAGKGFAVKGKFTLATTNTLTKADIISKPLKIQVAFLTSATGTNGAMTILQEAKKIKGFKARPKNFGKFVANPVGNALLAGNANVLLQATLGPEGINQEVSQLFTNPAPFQVRKVE